MHYELGKKLGLMMHTVMNRWASPIYLCLLSSSLRRLVDNLVAGDQDTANPEAVL